MPQVNIGDKIRSSAFPNGYGSVGCFVVPKGSAKLDGTYMLTNSHVVANEKQVVTYDGNTKISLDPGTAPNGIGPLEQIGVVYKALREFNHKLGYVDWALVKLDKGVTYSSTTMNGTKLSKWTDPVDDMSVGKRGATSGLTSGNVTSVDWRQDPGYLIGYPANVQAGKGLVDVTGLNFCLGGDSGSVIFSNDSPKTAIALLFGAGMMQTLAVPFRRILNSMKDKTKTEWELAPAV
jgi:hypothetical protein